MSVSKKYSPQCASEFGVYATSTPTQPVPIGFWSEEGKACYSTGFRNDSAEITLLRGSRTKIVNKNSNFEERLRVRACGTQTIASRVGSALVVPLRQRGLEETAVVCQRALREPMDFGAKMRALLEDSQ